MSLFKLLSNHKKLHARYCDLFGQVLAHSGCPSERMPVRAEMVIVEREFRSVVDKLKMYKN